MKILVIYDLNNYFNRYLPKPIKKAIIRLSQYDLNSFLKRTTNQNKSEISLINASAFPLNIDGRYDILDLSQIRLEINRQEYIKIKENVINSTKETLSQLNLLIEKKKIGYHNSISYLRLIEFDLSLHLNEIYGNFEILNYYILTHKFDSIVLFHCNNSFFKFFKILSNEKTKVEIVSNKAILNSTKVKNILSVLKFTIQSIGIQARKLFFKKKYVSNISSNKNLNTTIFVANSENQIKSVKPVYDYLKKENYPSLIYGTDKGLTVSSLFSLIQFIIKMQLTLKYQNQYIKSIKYSSISVEKAFKNYYFSFCIIFFAKMHNILKNVEKILRNSKPLVVITNDHLLDFRLIAQFCKIKNIPTLYIPHAAIPVIKEMISQIEIDFFALGGDADKEYFIQKGFPATNIRVTGVPRYEYFYKNRELKFEFIKDMFNGNSYIFKDHDHPILLTTNPINDESNEKIITTVINALKRLNLIENLVIKLHPREDGILHKKICQKLGVRPIIVKDYKILDLINSFDLMLSQKSTTILEAMIMGKPIVVLDLINKEFRESSTYIFLEEDIILKAIDQSSLVEKIEYLIQNDIFYQDYGNKLISISKKNAYYSEKNPPTKSIFQFILEIINKFKN